MDRLPGVIPLIWLAGTALLIVRFVIGLLGLRRLRHASEAVTDGGLLSYSRRRGSRMVLLQNEAISAPVTWGVVRHVILVPAGFEKLPAECRDAVLCHEMAHIQGHDFLLRSLAEIARALIWFQPLMWIAWRQLREEQELACDNRVLAAGGRPSAYAKLLLDWNVRPGMDGLVAVGIRHRGSLKRRLYALLDQDLRRDTVAGTGVLAIWFLGLATAFPLAALSLTNAIPVQQAPPHALPAISPQRAPNTPVPQVKLVQVRPAPTPVQVPAPPSASTNVSAIPTGLVFVANTILVIADATVKDTNGKTIEGLKAGDFAVNEDGKAQAITVCEFQKLGDSPVESYYILGYYSTNEKADGSYRRVGITLKGDPTAKLDYRAGYYASRPLGPDFTIDGVTDMDLGVSVTSPSVVYKIGPEYSEQARKAKYSGTVVLNVEISASGQATGVKVVKSLGMGLDENAVDAVTRWKFRPGMRDGNPVPVQAHVQVNFRLM